VESNSLEISSGDVVSLAAVVDGVP